MLLDMRVPESGVRVWVVGGLSECCEYQYERLVRVSEQVSQQLST